jgi:Kef-type K+ transport system membrane component KefB
MSGLCDTRVKSFFDDIIGVPNVGIHSYKIFGISYIDVVVVLIGAIMIAWFMKWSYVKTIVGTFILGIVVHKLLCVRSTVDKLIFSS